MPVEIAELRVERERERVYLCVGGGKVGVGEVKRTISNYPSFRQQVEEMQMYSSQSF